MDIPIKVVMKLGNIKSTSFYFPSTYPLPNVSTNNNPPF